MKRLVFLLLFLCWTLAGCEPAAETSASSLVGKILIQHRGSRDFVQLRTFQSVKAGEPLQTADSSSYGEFGLGYGFFVLLPNSQVTLLDLQTTEQGDLSASLRLDYGSVFVNSGHSMNNISLEVRTDYGTAALHGSSMVVTQDANNAKVYCLTGSAVATGSTSVSLMAGQSSTLLSKKLTPSEPQMDPYIFKGADPTIQKALTFLYLQPVVENQPTLTPYP